MNELNGKDNGGNKSGNKYFAQLRHHQENTHLYD